MSRPKLKKAKKRVQVSVSLSPDVAKLMTNAENKSKFIDDSVLGMKDIAIIINKIRTKSVSQDEACDEIADICENWSLLQGVTA